MDFLTETFENVISAILDVLTEICTFLFDWLPDSPFTETINDITLGGTLLDSYDWLGWLNWFLPLNSLFTIVGLIAAVLLVWACWRAFKTIFHFAMELIPL